MKVKWLVEVEGTAKEVGSYEEAAALFVQAVGKGARRVVLRRVVEYTRWERVKLWLARVLARPRKPKVFAVGG